LNRVQTLDYPSLCPVTLLTELSWLHFCPSSGPQTKDLSTPNTKSAAFDVIRRVFKKQFRQWALALMDTRTKGPILRAKFCRAMQWLVHSDHSQSHADGPNIAPSDRNFIHLWPQL